MDTMHILEPVFFALFIAGVATFTAIVCKISNKLFPQAVARAKDATWWMGWSEDAPKLPAPRPSYRPSNRWH